MSKHQNSPTGPTEDEPNTPTTAPTIDARTTWYIGFQSARLRRPTRSADAEPSHV